MPYRYNGTIDNDYTVTNKQYVDKKDDELDERLTEVELSKFKCDMISSDGCNSSTYNFQLDEGKRFSDYDFISFCGGNNGGYARVFSIPTKILNRGYIVQNNFNWNGANSVYTVAFEKNPSQNRSTQGIVRNDCELSRTDGLTSGDTSDNCFSGSAQMYCMYGTKVLKTKEWFNDLDFANFQAFGTATNPLEIKLEDLDKYDILSFTIGNKRPDKTYGTDSNNDVFVYSNFNFDISEILQGKEVANQANNSYGLGKAQNYCYIYAKLKLGTTDTIQIWLSNDQYAATATTALILGWKLPTQTVLFEGDGTSGTEYQINDYPHNYDLLKFNFNITYGTSTLNQILFCPAKMAQGFFYPNGQTVSEGTGFFDGAYQGKQGWFMIGFNNLYPRRIKPLTSNITINKLKITGYKNTFTAGYQNPLKNKVFSVLGDSISTFTASQPSYSYKSRDMYIQYSLSMSSGGKTTQLGQLGHSNQVWWGQLMARDGMIRNTTYAIGGTCTWGDNGNIATSPNNTEAGMSQYHVNAMNQLGPQVGSPDYILCFYGANEFHSGPNWATTSLSIWDSSKGDPSTDNMNVTGVMSTDGRYYQTESWALMVYRLKTKYPNAKVVCITPFYCPFNLGGTKTGYESRMYRTDTSWSDIYDGVEKSVHDAGGYCIRLDKLTCFNPTTTSGTINVNSLLIDTVHPNGRGMYEIWKVISGFLKSIAG